MTGMDKGKKVMDSGLKSSGFQVGNTSAWSNPSRSRRLELTPYSKNAYNVFNECSIWRSDIDVSDSDEEEIKIVSPNIFVMLGCPVRRRRINFQSLGRNAKTF